MKTGSFAVVGGDKRSAWLAELLRREGKKVTAFGIELAGIAAEEICCPLKQAVSKADYLILPVPLLDKENNPLQPYAKSHFSLDDLLEVANKKSVVFAGMPNGADRKIREAGFDFVDYFDSEYLKIMNAVPAALMKSLLNCLFFW